MRVEIRWTEVNEHSTWLDVPDDTNLDDEDTQYDLLDRALQVGGTYDGTVTRTVDEIEKVEDH